MRIVIVGAGIAGMATAWALTKAGHAVTLVEQAPALPNPLAASGDHHRLIRRAYGGADGYALMMDEAYEAWEALWADLGVSHYEETGILATCLREGDAADAMRAGLDRLGTPYERLSPADAAERFPYLDAQSLAYAVLTPDGGVLMSREIAHDLCAWLVANGVALRLDTRAVRIDVDAGRVETEAGEVFEGDRVVVGAGAWALSLLPCLADALTSYRTYVAYLHPPADLRAAWATAPGFVSTGGLIDGYVLPPVRGAGLKIGAAFTKTATTDPSSGRGTTQEEGEILRDAFAPPFARIAEYGIREVVSCVYTFTADERFLSRRIGRTLVVSACSGHGYKFGAAVGRRVAAAVESDGADALAAWLAGEAPRAVA